MLTLNVIEKQILNALRDQLIPWAGEGAPFILLGAPPQIIGTNPIIELPGKKLQLLHGTGQQVRVQSWPEENLNTITAPYMGCVVEGEADIITGTTTAMCRKSKIPGKRWIIQMPQKSFFLAPPLVPVSRGGRPHWERSQSEKAYSRILWMQFQSTGVRCHFCTSDKGKHWSHPYCFIYGTELYPLARTLIHEMTQQSQQYVPLVYFTLNMLFHYMIRGLVSQRAGNNQAETTRIVSATFGSADGLIQEIISFIDQNLNSKLLTVEQIAEKVHLSPSHLARVFKREMDVPVMEFVIQRRMELACQLLLESQFNIRHVADYSGYLSPSSFIKAFVRHYGVSPTAYRSTHQGNDGIEQ